MKAFIIKKYGTIGNIEQVEIDPPTIADDEVLVRVKSAAINPADIKVITGKNGGKFIHSGKAPIGLGFDYSGVINETGAAVSQFKQGDDVFGFLPYSRKTKQGSFADVVVVKSDTLAKKPSSITHTEAATAPTTASTALQALVDIGGIKQGQKILVNGASGGVGSYAVQIAKSCEAEVWGICSERNLDYIKSIGAEHALDYKKTALKDLAEKFDIILDAVSNSSFGECSPILVPKGVYITLLPSLGLVKGKIQSMFSAGKCAICFAKPRTADLAKIGEMIEEKVISTPVAATYPLAQLHTALEKFIAGGVRGKIGIVVEE
ncbi:MAG: NAD(P)-dependent alcohol dehydrogenase [Desulfobacterales bacterium]|jgi:NADPH:quinone reductase-like Zn-dependent oxidoreductase